MKPLFRSLTRLALALTASTAVLPVLSAQTPIFEARFNSATDMALQNGAVLGTGVSGQKDDGSYSGDPSKSDGQKGPLALTTTNNPADAMSEFTVTVWYKVRHTLHNDATLFDLFGAVLIWEEKSNQWVLRVDAKPTGESKPSSYWFRPGNTPPLGSWTNVDEWNFVAFVWRKSDKDVKFYQGNTSSLATLAKDVTRPEEVAPLQEKTGASRVIGNTAAKTSDRPFDGDVDNLRFYPKALSDAAIEKIRQADLKNKAVVLP